MIFFWAFVIGGLICVIGQLMFDVGKLTPAHTMATLVVAGAILDGGMFKVTSAGVSAAIIFGFIGALLFKPKG
ncbi:SpoVA/SpoVAEb family sporulation membrane protein [Bacillus paranthracis]|uniref:SpoVA/SpoVAEb family sporulation membrane protein n=1 Tax=Bacillus paranthracis TaxID=2026186 RepID=UPI0022E86E46|nr:SpoVA/SpoVAEb family sporulation membrane protein [Bacillus paranthracis]